MNLVEHMRRQMAFSRATFGPGERTAGVCDHIEKEIREIKEFPDDGLRSREWVDVVLLSLDGLWRALEAEDMEWECIPDEISYLIQAKQSKNEQRDWPDWRTAPKDKAIEHVKETQSPITQIWITKDGKNKIVFQKEYDTYYKNLGWVKA